MLASPTNATCRASRHDNCPKQQPVRPDFFQTSSPDSADPAAELRAGIARSPANVPPWYLYDEVGSRLFHTITAIPEYYPTRTEAAILAEHLPAMTKTTGIGACTLIDLGAGSCDKAPKLFPHVRPRQYVPVDISVDYLRGVVSQLQLKHPEIEMVAVGTDFSKNLVLPDCVHRERRLFFYPGSSIGNFDHQGSLRLLRQIKSQMHEGGAVWLGIDLIKDTETLERAYDDNLGVTAAFNRNLLCNINRIAGTDFNPREWQHVALYNPQENRIEMHLEAGHPVTVTWPGGSRTFSAGERMHTESSYKYTPDAFRELLAEAGLRTVGMWTDDKQWFAFFAAVSA